MKNILTNICLVLLVSSCSGTNKSKPEEPIIKIKVSRKHFVEDARLSEYVDTCFFVQLETSSRGLISNVLNTKLYKGNLYTSTVYELFIHDLSGKLLERIHSHPITKKKFRCLSSFKIVKEEQEISIYIPGEILYYDLNGIYKRSKTTKITHLSQVIELNNGSYAGYMGGRDSLLVFYDQNFKRIKDQFTFMSGDCTFRDRFITLDNKVLLAPHTYIDTIYQLKNDLTINPSRIFEYDIDRLTLDELLSLPYNYKEPNYPVIIQKLPAGKCMGYGDYAENEYFISFKLIMTKADYNFKHRNTALFNKKTNELKVFKNNLIDDVAGGERTALHFDDGYWIRVYQPYEEIDNQNSTLQGKLSSTMKEGDNPIIGFFKIKE